MENQLISILKEVNFSAKIDTKIYSFCMLIFAFINQL